MPASLAEEPTEHLFLYWNQKIFFPSPILSEILCRAVSNCDS